MLAVVPLCLDVMLSREDLHEDPPASASGLCYTRHKALCGQKDTENTHNNTVKYAKFYHNLVADVFIPNCNGDSSEGKLTGSAQQLADVGGGAEVLV